MASASASADMIMHQPGRQGLQIEGVIKMVANLAGRTLPIPNAKFGNPTRGPHCGLWQSRSPRAPPGVGELVLELDAAYSGNAIDAPSEADESHELTCVDIDTFLDSF